MLKFNIILFEAYLHRHEYESAKKQIHDVLIADPVKAEKICQLVLARQCGQVALSVLQHKIFPYCLSPETLSNLAKMNQLCAESFAENPKLLEKTGHDFILTLIRKYPSIYQSARKYWVHYSYDVLCELTKGNLQLLSDYFQWVSALEITKQAKHRQTVLGLFRDVARRDVAASLDTCPQILSIALTALPDNLTIDWQKELCAWVTEYHIEKLECPGLLQLFQIHPVSSQKALSNRCCITALANHQEGPDRAPQLNRIIQSCAVFSNEPLVTLNLFGSPIRKYLYPDIVKQITLAFCRHLIHPNPKVDFLFLLNVFVFIEKLSSKLDVLKKKQERENLQMPDPSMSTDFQSVSAFTPEDVNELRYLKRLLSNLNSAFQSRFKIADASFQIFVQCLAQEIPFEEREGILQKVEAAYFQADRQKDPRKLQYDQIYNCMRKIHAKDIHERLRQLISDCILSDQEVLQGHQDTFLTLYGSSPLAFLVHQYNRLDCLHIVVRRSASTAPDELKLPLEALKLQIETDLEISSEKRKKIRDSLVFLVKADPRNYCNEALRLCYLLYAEHAWSPQYIDTLWINFFPERLNHSFLDGCGHFYFAKMLIRGEERQEIIPLQFSQKTLVTIGAKKVWQYSNPWYRMLEVAHFHLERAEASRYADYDPLLTEQVKQKLSSMPQYLDLETGALCHQSLTSQVQLHFQQYPQIQANRRIAPAAVPEIVPPPTLVNAAAHALGFSVIEVPKQSTPHSGRPRSHIIQSKTPAKQHIPSPLIPKPAAAPPREIVTDTSDDLMALAEQFICQHVAQTADTQEAELMTLLTQNPTLLLTTFHQKQSQEDPGEQHYEAEDMDELVALEASEDGEFFSLTHST